MVVVVVVVETPGFLDLCPVDVTVDVGGSLLVVAAAPLDASDRESSVAAALAVSAGTAAVVAVVAGRWLVAVVVLRGGAMILNAYSAASANIRCALVDYITSIQPSK